MKMRHKFVLATVLLLMITGCAHSAWVKPGASQAQVDQDQYQCSQEAAQYAGAAYGSIGPFAVAWEQETRLRQCLLLRGYQLVRQP